MKGIWLDMKIQLSLSEDGEHELENTCLTVSYSLKKCKLSKSSLQYLFDDLYLMLVIPFMIFRS